MMNEIIAKTPGFMHIVATEGDVEYLMATCDEDGARAPLAALPLPRAEAAAESRGEGWEATRAIAAAHRGEEGMEKSQGCGPKG